MPSSHFFVVVWFVCNGRTLTRGGSLVQVGGRTGTLVLLGCTTRLKGLKKKRHHVVAVTREMMISVKRKVSMSISGHVGVRQDLILFAVT